MPAPALQQLLAQSESWEHDAQMPAPLLPLELVALPVVEVEVEPAPVEPEVLAMELLVADAVPVDVKDPEVAPGVDVVPVVPEVAAEFVVVELDAILCVELEVPADDGDELEVPEVAPEDCEPPAIVPDGALLEHAATHTDPARSPHRRFALLMRLGFERFRARRSSCAFPKPTPSSRHSHRFPTQPLSATSHDTCIGPAAGDPGVTWG